MEYDPRVPRFLGAAFVFQFATSLTAGILSMAILSGSISEVLDQTAANINPMRASIILQLLTSIGILALASLLYVVLRNAHRGAALIGLVLWVAEAVVLAVSTLGRYALLTLSEAPWANQETLGATFLGLEQHAADIALLFFGVGAVLWYALLYRSRVVPRLLAAWGLVAALGVLFNTLLLAWDRSIEVSFLLYLPYIPFELVIGLWLLVRGAQGASARAV